MVFMEGGVNMGYGGSCGGGCGFGGGFALLVVLFILLIIVGASCWAWRIRLLRGGTLESVFFFVCFWMYNPYLEIAHFQIDIAFHAPYTVNNSILSLTV